jgi:tetratricopeptide (TPR) repeat protein
MKLVTPGDRKSVIKLASLFVVILILHTAAAGQQSAVTSSNPPVLPVGSVVPKVLAIAKPDQSYALYLPAGYSPAKRWPIVYVFDPGAHGVGPVELMKDAAERHGYIVVGSNNSRNGPRRIASEAALAMLRDTQARFSLDKRRFYFAGFSGGARVAASVAQACRCAAGVLLNGAGFGSNVSTTPGASFAVFATVGMIDFNYAEIVQLDDQLEKLGYAHFLFRFDGPHQWAPKEAMEEALAWFRLQAMKNGLEERDTPFIIAEAARESQRAAALEQSGDLYAAWKEYRQASEMLAGLADNATFRARAEALEKDKAIREGAKREKKEFEDQAQLMAAILTRLSALQENIPVTDSNDTGLSTLQDNSPVTDPNDAGLSALQESATVTDLIVTGHFGLQESRAEIRREVEAEILDLRARTEHEELPEKLRVLHRSLAGVFGMAMDTGMLQLLDKKDVPLALEYFELALDANPDSVWALGELAVAKASMGDDKGALQALRNARSRMTNPAAFAAWLNEQPAFAKLRGTPEFTALLEPAPQH